ncbi:MAG: site-2 protease family protein [Candidatus Micrarchaeota archaeon]|nr:site-2 protease family protein [Candidatus Micrarchaeota archaeon]MDE1834036.1 site-2 protease family protein [Candidatus Micrarchaeota archaeon]MDE1859126.1 site-2 protease family protein [Candidatus Micrarchaeota archaeon]
MADGSISIGKILGIDIELHWLFILMIAFFFLLSPLWGLVWVLLFVCVLIHELAHSITARRNNVKVSKIVLIPLGGASIIDDTRIDTSVEFRISIVGPITSLVLGGIFGISVLFTPPGLVTFLVQYLFLINILLGIFNILPIFPMDGGRVMRSYLEKRMSFFKATMTTVKVSKYFMALMIIAALALFVVPNQYTLGSREVIFLWTIFIVFFLYQGAIAEQDSAIVRHETEGVRLREALTKDYEAVDYNSDPGSLYNIIKSKNRHLIVSKTPDGQYVLINVFGRNQLQGARRLSDLSIPIPNLDPNMGMAEALAKIDTNPYRIAAVVSKGKLVGLATGNHLRAFISLHSIYRRSGKGF